MDIAELSTKVGNDLSWRRKEISDLKATHSRCRDLSKKVVRRGGIALAYAHLEGFVKFSSRAYIESLNKSGVKVKDLDRSYLAVSLSSKSNDIKSTCSIKFIIDFIGCINDVNESSFKLDPSKISTKSNLKYKVLEEIFLTLGIDASKFETSKVWLDTLVDKRNAIAHGEGTPVSENEFDDFCEKVLLFMQTYSDELQNKAVLEYNRQVSASITASPQI